MAHATTPTVTIGGHTYQIGETTPVPAGLKAKCDNPDCQFDRTTIVTDDTDQGRLREGVDYISGGPRSHGYHQTTGRAAWWVPCPGCGYEIQFQSDYRLRG